MRSRAFLNLCCLFGLVATIIVVPNAGAQDGPRAVLAPAIGPWLGAPRGSISAVRATDGGISITATAHDPDSASPIDYQLTVDGTKVDEGETPRPEGFGATVEFDGLATTSDGLHTVCLRLGDNRFGMRTVDCTTATTAPPDTVPRAVANRATGALVTTNNVVVPVTGGQDGAWEVITPCGEPAIVASGTYVDRARVVIDPGHGGSESGAAGPGILEKDLNLAVSEEVVERLNDLGISAQITRPWDYRIPIKTRADIATALAPDVFLSLHHNGGATRRSSRPGTEVFYAEGKPESQRLARIMYEDMVSALSQYDVAWVSTVSEGASLRLREDGMDLYGIHRYSPDINSLITEFVYLSNRPEAALMQQPGMVEVEAQTIVDALLRWWWTDDTGPTRGRQFVDESSSGTGGFDGCVDPTLNANRALGIGREDVLTDRAAALSTARQRSQLLPALYLATDPSVSR